MSDKPHTDLRADEALHRIVEQVSATSGGVFYRRLAEVLGSVFDACYAGVGQLSGDGDHIQLLGSWTRQTDHAPSEYSLQHTPAAAVVQGEVRHHADGLRRDFPLDDQLQRLLGESYIGVPIIEAHGDVLGLIELVLDTPLPDATVVTTILLAMAERAAVEIGRGQAEAALRDSEARYRALVEDSFHLVAEVVDECIVYASVGYRASLGYEPEDVLGGSVFDLMHPDDRRGVAGELHAMLVEQRPAKFTVRMRHRSGAWRWVESTGRVFRTSSGEYRATLFSRDITDRLQAEDALRESEEQYRLLAEHSTDLIGRFSTEGVCLWISPSALPITGYTAAELVGDEPGRHIHPDDLAEVVAAVQAHADGAATSTSTFRFQHKDGHYIWLEARGKAIVGDDGQVQEIQSTTRDVTLRIARGVALQESEERFRVMAENASDIIVRFDPEGVCTWISPSVKELGGWDPVELVGTRPRFLVHPDDQAMAPMAQLKRQEVLTTTNTVTTTFRFPRKDGTFLWMESKSKAIRDPETGEVVEIQLAARDITARKEIEDALRGSNERYRSLSEASPLGVFETDATGACTYVNQRAQEIAGQPLERCLGPGWALLIHPADIAHVHDLWSAAATGVHEFEAEYRMVLAGSESWVHVKAVPVAGDDGRISMFVGSVEDITQRRLAEDALRRSEQLFRATLESTADAIIVTQPGGEILYWNTRAAEMLRMPAAVLETRRTADLISYVAGQVDEPQELLRQLQSLPTDRPSYVGIWITKIGRRLEAFAHPIEDPASGLVRVWSLRDITEKHMAVEALRESQERLRTVVNSAPLVLLGVDAAGIAKLAEGAGLASIGVDPQAIVGQHFRTLFAAYPESASDIERALEGEEVISVRELGGLMFETRFVPQRGAEGASDGMIAIAYDVTARVQAEGDLRESEETARALLNAPTDGAVLVDREGMILAMNATAEQRFREHATAQQVNTANLVGTCVFDLFPPELREQRKARNDEVFANGERRHFEDERDGAWTDVTIDPILNAEGRVTRVAIFSRDITDRKSDEAALGKRSRELEALNDYLEKTSAELERSQHEAREASEQLAQLLDAEQVRSKTDTLTGALNHGAILKVAAEAIAAEVGLAVAMVDVDGMKSVNDTYGHQAGDDLLMAVAAAINRGGAITGRYGGDEFLVALLGASRTEAEEYKQAVETALKEAQVIDPESGARVPVVVSVGIAIYPEDASTLTDLIERADEQMYEEKKQRGGSTGLSSSRILGDERTARMVGELVPLLTSGGTLDEKLGLVAHRLSVGAGYAGVNFDVFAEGVEPAEGVNTPMSQNAFTKAPEEVREAWNRQQRDGAGTTGVGEILRQTRRPIIIDSIEHSELVTDEQRALLLSIGIVSAIVVPLFSEDAMVASMSVGSKELAGFGQKDVLFLTAVAGQVAAIIRMARLVEHLRRATDRGENDAAIAA
jgi:diguanylate cyclase (GGDEF)-like protein/PAS domain S-box-containing protein